MKSAFTIASLAIVGFLAYYQNSKANFSSEIHPSFAEPAARACLGGRCFAAGTSILMEDGSSKSIEQMQVGDFVLGKSSPTNTVVGTHEVTAIFRDSSAGMISVWLVKNGVTNEVIATSDHSFWEKSNGWQPASHLKSGQVLMDKDGGDVIVGGTSTVTGTTATYNLNIRDVETYFVVVNGVSVLVHK